jgi:tRNA (guanine6-N2)-methyltransferase
MTDLLFTTNAGLEGIVAAEFDRRLADAGLAPAQIEKCPLGLNGQLRASHPAPLEGILSVSLRMRSVHHVSNLLFSFELSVTDPLDGIATELEQREIGILRCCPSFRVTSKRHGEHDFSSEDVQRAAGAALVRRYGLRVDLKGYDKDVRVDVCDGICTVGIQYTRDALSRRWARVYSPRPALKATVAYALVHLARIRPYGGPVLDPFCGSGTVLFEAASLYPDVKVHGSDLFDKAVEGTRANAQAVGLGGRLLLRQGDACDLSSVYPDRCFQAIIADPPYGVRQGRRLNFYWLYSRFLAGACALLAPGGRLVVIAWKRGVFERVLRDMDCFVVQQILAVETGGIYPRVYVLRPK